MRPNPALLLLAAAPAVAQPSGWEARLPEWGAALRACLQARPGAMVVDAAEEAGRVSARLLLPGGGQADCRADPAEPHVAVDDLARTDGAGAPLGPRAFMLERRCVDAWRVMDAAGREIGWLAYPACG